MDLPLEIEVSIHFIFTFTTLQTTNESIKYNKVLKLSIRKQPNSLGRGEGKRGGVGGGSGAPYGLHHTFRDIPNLTSKRR